MTPSTPSEDPMSPRHVPVLGQLHGRPPPPALAPALLIAALTITLAACSTTPRGDPTQAPSAAPATSEASTPPGLTTSSTPPAATTSAAATPSTPEEQAAVDAEVAYRANTTEGFRHLNTAIHEAATQWGGTYVRTPELDAILEVVATDPEFNESAAEPGLVLEDAPTAVGMAGAPVVTDVRIDTVELYDPPRTVNDQGGITALVTLTSCVDATSVKTLGPDGKDLFPESGVRILRETVTVRQQPHFITGTPGWYVADRTNTVEQTCDLP